MKTALIVAGMLAAWLLLGLLICSAWGYQWGTSGCGQVMTCAVLAWVVFSPFAIMKC